MYETGKKNCSTDVCKLQPEASYLRVLLVAKFLVCLTNLSISKQDVMGRGDSDLSQKKNGKIKICGHLVHENPHHISSLKAVEELPSLEVT